MKDERKEINRLKKEKNAVILAHNYQLPEVQQIADYVGDSFGLSKKVAEMDVERVVFCGVEFMAETAKILSPEKTVLLPEPDAGCPLAEMITVEDLLELKEKHPQAAVVAYVNSTARVKAESDICCTSSSAVRVVNSLDEEEVIFVPDKNLAHYVDFRTEKKIIFPEGNCLTHHRVRAKDVELIREKYPETPVAVHPECRPEVVKRADYVGSTAGILDYAKSTGSDVMIVGTEMGIFHRLENENPEIKFYLLSPGLVCLNMKKINMEKIIRSLQEDRAIVEVPENIAKSARSSLERMLEV